MTRLPLIRRQDLRSHSALLGREEAEPDSLGLVALTPESCEILQVARPVHHLAGDGAVNRDLGSGDVLQDSLIGSGLAPHVMFRLQPIDGTTTLSRDSAFQCRGIGRKALVTSCT